MEKKLFFNSFVLILMAIGMVGCMTNRMAQDPYIWLEEVNSEKALAWVKERNQRTFNILQSKTTYSRIKEQAMEILSATDKIPMISFHKKYVYNFWTDLRNPRGIYRRTTFADYQSQNPHWETLIDIDQLGVIEGKSWVFQGCTFYEPNPKHCLMYLSDGGKDAREVREFDLETKTFVNRGFFLPNAKSSVAWLDQNTILISTDFGPSSLTASGYPREIRILKRGQDLATAEKIFEIPATSALTDVYTEFSSEEQETYLTHHIDFYSRDVFVFKNKKEFVKLEIPQTANFFGKFKGQYYFSLTHDWLEFKAGTLLRSRFGEWKNAEVVYMPSATSSFESVQFSKNNIYLSVSENVVQKVYKLGSKLDLVPFPAPGIGNTYIASLDGFSDHALFTFESPIVPTTLYSWNSELKKIKSTPDRFNSANLLVEQYEATSFDGMKIPYFLIRDKSKTGPQPTLMTGYGGFQISNTPYYDGIQGKLWLTQGGQFVVANIRGGGEFGPKWHMAALKKNRQVAYNDLFAVTEDLFKKGFTTPAKLAFTGRSNGGLLAGVALTQRPDLYKAIHIGMPLLDMLRYHKLPAGALWIGEYGNPEIENEKEYIQKYSPYQNLKEGQKYPSILITTSTFDDRVHPGHARKFAARLEELKIPFLYFENMEGGHAGTADMHDRAHFLGLYYAFLYDQLMTPTVLP